MAKIPITIPVFLYVFNITMLPHFTHDLLVINGTIYEFTKYYFPNCTLNLVLFGKNHLLQQEVPIKNTFYYNQIYFNSAFNLSILPSGNYTLTYYIKCGKIHYIPGMYSIHLSLNPIYYLLNFGEGVKYYFVWKNDKNIETAYIDKGRFEVSGSTGTYAPLVYTKKISFSLYLNKKARLIVEQCSTSKCYKIYEKIVNAGFLKDFLTLREYKKGEIYWLKFKVIDLDYNKVTDYFELPIVIPGDIPNFIYAYLDENSTHLLFKPIDPNLKSVPTTFTIILDNKEKQVNLPELTREEIYNLKIKGLYSKVCVKEWEQCYFFDINSYKQRIHLFKQNIERLLRKNVSNKNNTRKEITKRTNYSTLYIYIAALTIILLGLFTLFKKLRS